MLTLDGLPAHPLLVHLTVVAIPLAALLGIVAVLWPRARTWMGLMPSVVALVAVVMTPITTSAGEALIKTKRHINPALEKHEHLGDQMIYWVAPLFVAIVLFWALTTDLGVVVRYRDSVPPLPARATTLVLGAAVIVTAIGSIIWVYRIGHLGAESVWKY
ncbi:DUF2231 domain-containing protein [Jongsikchunia kroppenstedtii]|uniref:DUF2231 domain-containing protein n=1 Tax=Jongsikchunia kroppenstedtii TaxID=1121721 RepID=UPI00037FEFC6|nr:DUF2231 domain-containing protein [Jongsikchunia kroppenstedtii]